VNFQETFPHEVRQIENAWIPMPDGIRLAARIWMPDTAEAAPVPAILEYIPYRKRDNTRVRDSMIQHYMAGYGYAAVRVDMRGSGDSEGVLMDEYILQEQEDGLAVLRWIADRPWCDGNIGMIGISWGGFNGLQIAARRPPALKAVITVCSTDDRYADDVHYMGGCLLGDNLSWASTMFAYNSCPPDPEIVGKRWRAMWRKRLEGSGLWVANWLRHQRRDAYWKHGSICEDWEAIQVPVFAVSGWADGYSNAVFRLLKNLRVPRRGLIGPWSHKYPHVGRPGPAIGWLQECRRWWDHWLKGEETGMMNEPMLRVYMQESVPPNSFYAIRPGRWVGEPEWPTQQVTCEEYLLAPLHLLPAGTPIREEALTLESPLRSGLFAGKWCSYSAPPDLPGDQREDDGGALTFDTKKLPEPVDILGAPEVELELDVNRPAAMVAVRLSDVRPEGPITRITYGLLNLTHRNNHEQPEVLEPGRRYRVRIGMNHVAQHFPAGHRIRLAVSTVYWPLAWPAPEPVRMNVHTGVSFLRLPVRAPRPEDNSLRPFDPPEAARPIETIQMIPEDHRWTVIRDLANGASVLEVIKDDGQTRIPEIGLEHADYTEERYSVTGEDLGSLRGETLNRKGFKRGDWDVSTRTHTVMTATPDTFIIHADLDAYEGDRRIYCRTWERHIPRDHV
jgi:hypothetical protein